MKYITAIIRPEKLEEAVSALGNVEIRRLTVSDCRGIGGMDKLSEGGRGPRYAVHYRLKVKMEIAVKEEFAQPAVETIRKICHTGDPTDGVIFISELEEFVDIATGKTGADAI